MAGCGLRRRRSPALEAAAVRAASACRRRACGRRGAPVPPAGPYRAGGRALARPAAAGRALGRRAAGRPMAAPPQLPRGGLAPRRHAGAGGGGLDGGSQRRPAAGTRADHGAVPDGRRARTLLPRCLEARGRGALAGARGRDLAAFVPRRPVPPLCRQPGAQRLSRHPAQSGDSRSGCCPPAAAGRRLARLQGVT